MRLEPHQDNRLWILADVVGVSEIELQTDTIRISHKDLLHGPRRHIQQLVFDASGLETVLRVSEPGDGKCNMVEWGGSAPEELISNTHMQQRMTIGVQPGAGGVERRAVTDFEAEHARIELDQTFEIRCADVEVVYTLNLHRASMAHARIRSKLHKRAYTQCCAATTISLKCAAMTTPTYQIQVNAQSVYVREQSQPEDDRYLFAYTIVIRNTGDIPAQLKPRHWVITDSNGKVQEVRGEGVVGEYPHLNPGEQFTYTSAAILETPVGAMHGSYQMVADDGFEFDAPIDAFRLSMPDMLH